MNKARADCCARAGITRPGNHCSSYAHPVCRNPGMKERTGIHTKTNDPDVLNAQADKNALAAT
jgi:hypothetical protein